MTSRTVCIGDGLDTDGQGRLRLSDGARVVAVSSRWTDDPVATSSVTTSLPGTEIYQTSLKWTNNTGIDRTVVLLWNRPSLHVRIAQPNAVQMRAKSVFGPGTSQFGATPDPSHDYDAAWTVSYDKGTQGNGVPKYGHYTRMIPGGVGVRQFPVADGDTVSLSWSLHLWNPPPYADNASNNNPIHDVIVSRHHAQVLALPDRRML